MNRFIVVSSSDAVKKGYPNADDFDDDYQSCWLLYETDGQAPLRVVASDGGEPEDQLLVRDWRWVPDELNKLAVQLAEQARELAEERAWRDQAVASCAKRRCSELPREIAELQQRLTAQAEEIERLKEDADRWAFLREHARENWMRRYEADYTADHFQFEVRGEAFIATSLDEAIDAARARANKGE